MESRSNGSSTGSHHALGRTRSRLWLTIQPYIVRIYKIAGLVALTAILIGLVGFLIVNVFYFFDHTWVRPVVLTPTHQKVVEASTQLADAKLREASLESEELEAEAEAKANDHTFDSANKFLTDVGTAADKPTSPEAWLVHREVEKARLDRENAEGRRVALQKRKDSLVLRIKDQRAVVHRLEQSPYLRAMDNKVQLAFVPYTNRGNVKIGTKLYGCHWGLVWCKHIGDIKTVIDGEVQDIHPHDESVQRGFMVEIKVDPDWEGEAVMFAGSKPLWFL
jgi:hypothetical protein